MLLLHAERPREVVLKLAAAPREAVLADPLSATTQALRPRGRVLPGLRLPDYPVVLRLK
ncbi:MAG: hypothetical protein M5U26_24385 [Planctomycetota bacterium]|nr:hypothetical protein [Planctomycetota bacterium]